MDKRKQIVLIILGVLILTTISFGIAYRFRNRRTYSLNIPQAIDLQSISIEVSEEGKNYSASYDEEEVIKEILDTIAGDKRVTKNESIQDYPINASDVIKVEFYLKDEATSTIYLYQKKNKYYIEEPYNGIYQISEDEYKKINEYTIVPYENETANNNKISMSIKNNTLTDAEMTLVMKNNSDQTYYYGPQYSLEKYENGKFVLCEPKEPLFWNAVLYDIKAGEEKEEVINWSYGYDNFKSGKYRLVRYFTPEEKITSSANVSEKYYVEFEVAI